MSKLYIKYMENENAQIQDIIYEIRGQKVMLDSDLAGLYGVMVKRLNECVKRNLKRFPVEFMFQLTDEEWKNLRSQFATFSKDTRTYTMNKLIEKPKATKPIGFNT